MAMGSERSTPSSSSSRPLHNFNLPGLRWGNQRFLRCKNVNSTVQVSSAGGGRRSSPSSHSGVLNNGDSNVSDFGPLIGKRKERENFDDPSRSPADYLRGSEFRKSGLSAKSGYPALPKASVNTDCGGRRIKLPPSGGDDGDGIAAVREKLMIDLQTETDKIKVAIFKEGLESEVANENTSPPAPVAVSSSVVVTVAEAETANDGALRPWNLRTRRAAWKAPTVPNGFSGGAGTSNSNGGSSPGKAPKLELMKPVPSLWSLRPGAENLKSPRLRSGVAAGTSTALPGNEKKERAKFLVALSRRETEEDFVAMTGRKPPRRPQKRLKYIQRTLDTLFPGLGLSEINADMYKVPETQ